MSKSGADRSKVDRGRFGEKLQLKAAALSIPLVMLPVLVSLGLLMLYEISPALRFPTKETTVLEGWTLADQSRFANAALIWAGLAAGVLISLLATLVFSVVVFSKQGGLFYTLLSLFIISVFGIIVFLWNLGDPDPLLTALNGTTNSKGPFIWPVGRFTLVGNTLTAAVIAGLFAASGALAYRAVVEPCRAVELWARLRTLLSFGAVATVLGVLEITALGSMAAAVVSATAAEEYTRVDLGRALTTELDREVHDALEAGSSNEPKEEFPILTRWSEDTGPIDATDELQIAIALAGAHELGDNPVLRAEMLSSVLAGRRELVEQSIRSLYSHGASFWGMLFTLALALMYLPSAYIIVLRGRKCEVVPSETSGAEPQRILLPLLRIATALAPLVVGVFGEYFQSIDKLLG